MVIALAAGALKLIVLFQLGHHPLLQPAGDLDSGYYVDLAERVRAGGLALGSDAYFVAPFYVYFLGALFTLFDGSLVAVRLVQVVLGAAAVWLVGATARIWFSDRAAIVAALLAAGCGLFTFYEILILQAAVDPFLTALGLYLVGRAADKREASLPQWAGAGLVLGLHALNRPNVLPYAAVVVALVAARPVASAIRRKIGTGQPDFRPKPETAGKWARAFATAGAFAAGVTIALAPVTLRNYAVTGELIPISSHGGLNLYIGNNPEADGTYHRVPGITPSMAGQVRDARRVAEQALGRQLGSGEVSGYFYSLAYDWILTHPRDALVLQTKKLAYLLNATPLTLNFSYPYYSRDEPGLLRGLLVGPGVLIPLGLAGLFLRTARGRRSGYWAWAAFVPVYGLSVAAFFISSRYRMPLLVPLCASAGAAVDWMWRAASPEGLAHNRRPWLQPCRQWSIVRGAAALVLLAVLANWDFGLDDGRSEERTQMILALTAAGRDAEAERRLATALRDHPQPGLLHFRYGRALHARGRLPGAIANYQRALEIDRAQPEVRFALGQALFDSGMTTVAIEHLDAACATGVRPDRCGLDLARALVAAGERSRGIAALKTLDPPGIDAAATLYDAGDLALQLGEPRVAERFLMVAILRAPDSSPAHQKLGLSIALQGRHEEALPRLEEAVRLDARDPTARLNLAVEYAHQRRDADARREAGAALEIEPGYERARSFLAELERRR